MEAGAAGVVSRPNVSIRLIQVRLRASVPWGQQLQVDLLISSIYQFYQSRRAISDLIHPPFLLIAQSQLALGQGYVGQQLQMWFSGSIDEFDVVWPRASVP